MRILLYPDPALRQPAEPVVRIDKALRRAAREMFVAMYDASGVGLAATQVGLPLRLLIFNLGGDSAEETVLINPEVLREGGEQIVEEGCLSLPGVAAKIRRPVELVIRGYDLEGNELEYECRDLCARTVSHEIDHLEGRLIIDRMGSAARLTNQARLKELEEHYPGAGTFAGEPAPTGVDSGLRAGTDDTAALRKSDS